MSNAWLTMSMADLGRGIAKGEIDPVNLTRTYLDAIKAHPFGDRIYAPTDGRACDVRGPAPRPNVHDLGNVWVFWTVCRSAGKTCLIRRVSRPKRGPPLLKDRVPDQDAEVLRNATAAG